MFTERLIVRSKQDVRAVRKIRILQNYAKQRPSCAYIAIWITKLEATYKEYKYEEEILAVQNRSRIPRQQAKLIFDRENPQYRQRSYASALFRLSNSSSSQHAMDHQDRESYDDRTTALDGEG